MKQLGELIVGDYMTGNVVVVDDTSRLTEAIRIMQSEQHSALPVADQQARLVGMLSTSDLIQLTAQIQSDLTALHHVGQETQDFLIQHLIDQGDSASVSEFMTESVVTVNEDTNMVVAARLLLENRCHHLPVVDRTGKAIGVLSTSDFVQAFADHGVTLAG